MIEVEYFELPVANLMEQQHQRHPLRQGQAALAQTMALTVG
ncbi:hypothetical protein ACCUM_4098 [Candidatus Accumulibacter phosphatis]|uniref:Uncharacterized protein n=1 Tax=Candidatus Accumulibacter phosphatis TaxID=327160 RepID=A0A5S4EML2_9PROT|nr:hypothetical protein ACCUM_4098 [Candidatus Accumulibacter phosphatis]